MGLLRNVLKQLRLNKLSVVQATQAPQLYRWKKRKDMLWPLLDDPEILDMSYQLAYDKDDIEGWF